MDICRLLAFPQCQAVTGLSGMLKKLSEWPKRWAALKALVLADKHPLSHAPQCGCLISQLIPIATWQPHCMMQLLLVLLLLLLLLLPPLLGEGLW